MATLERACRSVAIRKTIRVDRGSEFICRDLWACQKGVELDFYRTGKAANNAFIESFRRQRAVRVGLVGNRLPVSI